MFELLLIALVLVAAYRVNARVKGLERRVVEVEAELRRARGPAPSVDEARPAEPPDTPAIPAALPEPPASAAPDIEAPPPPPPPVAAAPPPPPSRGLEEVIGTRWAVWVGGLALGLGGLLLVRYSIEQDLIGPGLRVALGALLALALIGAGEWLRRREQPFAVAAFPRADIPAVLTAAGTSTAFAVAYAAYGLYGLIGPAPAFILLGAISALTMVAAALHGPALAGLGLAAALGSPLLVETSDPSPIALVVYLAFAVGTAYAVARLRLWRWLAIAGAAGAVVWGVFITVSGWDAASILHALTHTALAILFLVADPHRVTSDAEARTDRFAAAILFALALLACLVAATLPIDAARPLFAAATITLFLGAAFRFAPAAPAAGAAALVALGTLATWPVALEASREPIRVLGGMMSSPVIPAALETYLGVALLFAAAPLLVSFWRVALGPALRPALAGWHLGAATLGPLAILVVVYGRVAVFERSVPLAAAAAALAAIFTLAATRFRDREARFAAAGAPSAAAHLAVGAAASAAIAALALGLTIALDRGILTVSLSLAALGAAYVADRARVPALRYVVGALAVAVAGRLAFDPTVAGGDPGATPILNWLLFGYGVPALAFGLAARLLSRTGRGRIVRLVETLAILLSAVLVFMEIRHAIHGRDFLDASPGHLEAGLVLTEGLGFSLLMARIARRDAGPFYRAFSLGFAALSALWGAALLGFAQNPFLTDEPISGGAILNTLIPAYLFPAVMAAALAWASRRVHPYWFTLAAAALALLLELAFAGLEIRRLFQGPQIGFDRPTGDGELWSYSLLLIANGVALLAAGFALASQPARIASAACIVAAVVKVFVVDLANLGGLARAFSFVGLGLTLVAIGFVYQRLFLARPAPTPAPSDGA